MVATRRGAKKAPELEVAPAPTNTLNAPPKRGGRKKAVSEEVAPPAPAVKPAKATTTKATKPAASKRKADAEPEGEPAAKKPAANTKATRVSKVETEASEPKPAAAKRATRGKKAAEPIITEEPEKQEIVEEAPKPAATRGRKAAVKKAVAPKNKPPTVVAKPTVDQQDVDELMGEEAPKPAPRGRKPAAKKAAPVDTANVEETVAAEPVKPAPRARKAAVPKPPQPEPVLATRSTRGRAAIVAPKDSPIKKPARRPAKKAAPVAKKPELAVSTAPVLEPTPVQEPFAEYPGYPATPAHIVAPVTSRRALAELPGYPNTPAHIIAPISSKNALAALPDYPKTPAHITAPIGAKAALNELAGYPNTPAHIKAPISTKDAIAEMAGYPKTPAHIKAPISAKDALAEMPDYPKTPAHISVPVVSTVVEEDEDTIMEDAPEFIEEQEEKAPISNEDAIKQLPSYPNTPAHIVQPLATKTPLSSRKALAELPIDCVRTPVQSNVAQSPSTIGLSKLPRDCFGTPAQVSSPVIEEEISNQGADGPHTPTQIVWGVTNQEAFEELPEYPKTPAHITAPVSNRDALAQLPSYPATPVAIELAMQEQISASVKKQTPSPLSRDLGDISFDLADRSEMTEPDTTEAESELPAEVPIPNLQLAPIQLSATLPASVGEAASPKKSALRSPQKLEAKTPKKAVTWDDKDDSDLFVYGGARPLEGLTFFVDITSHGMEHNYVFIQLLEDLGAKVPRQFEDGVTHVLFKDGNIATLQKVLASKGTVKCVNVGFVLECERELKRVDETPYLVDLSSAIPPSPSPKKTLIPATPARTPSRYAVPATPKCNSIPTTPTSSEFDHSINVDDDKENSEVGLFFQDMLGIKGQAPRTCPQQKSFLYSRSAIKTPSRPNFLGNSPMKPFSTGKKRSHDTSFANISMSGQPKKMRFLQGM